MECCKSSADLVVAEPIKPSEKSGFVDKSSKWRRPVSDPALIAISSLVERRLASDFLSKYIFLPVGSAGLSTGLMVRRVEFVQESDKRSHLMDLLHAQKDTGSNGTQPLTLVFVENKKGADSLEYWLYSNGFSATTLHGDRSQLEREQALRSFKSRNTPSQSVPLFVIVQEVEI